MEKQEQTYPLYSVLLPRSIISFQTLTHQVEEIGDNTEKSSFPPGEPTEPISVCATPKCSNYSSFSHCERLHITSSLLLELEENCSGEAFPHHLHSSEQSGSSCEWNYKGHGTILDYEQSARMNIPMLSQDGQSLLEWDSVYLQQRIVHAETLTQKCYAVF